MWYKIRGTLALTFIALNLSFWIPSAIFVAMIKLLVPLKRVRSLCNSILTWIYILVVWIDDPILRHFVGIDIKVSGLEGVSRNNWYLIIANHQSWSDTLILQDTFNYKMPLLKFVVKQELLYVPLLGFICWAYDYPFVKRYSKSYLQQNPEKKTHDRKRLKKACQKLAIYPASILNFVEGTRFTPSKHQRQASPYRHLLLPRAGGVAVVLEALESYLDKILNVTIVYDTPNLTLLEFLGGKCKKVVVLVEQVEVSEILGSDINKEETSYFAATKLWLNQAWPKKDEVITQNLGSS